MPPVRRRGPLECSEGTSPAHVEKALALSNLENTPASATRANAVISSMPFRQRRASTRPRQRGSRAWARMNFSSSRFWPSMWRTCAM